VRAVRVKTLESLHANFLAAPTADAACQNRGRARKLAASLGVDVPEWAAQRIAPRGTHAKPAPAPPAAPAQAQDIPEALRAWRCAQAARCVSIGSDAVTLTTWIDGSRHDASYPTIEMACAAVASGEIAWRRGVNPVLKSRFNRAA
jgi:hypothetical protein